ncbi:amidophosphoribosyltransferase [Desulfonispora thiosulfatigenes]|nr:amidophosphoribosyltransferase [Desulfonispora thiosulfatigenes]
MEEECGVFGIYGPGNDVASLTYYGLFALQHRGQESAGIAVTNGNHIKIHKNVGLVTEVFSEEDLKKLKGDIAIGHVQYSTTGITSALDAQPIVCSYLQGNIALAHNGSLTNAKELRNKLANNGSVFQSSTDSEVFVNLIAHYGQNPIEESLMKCMIDVKGSYSLVVMTENKLLGVRDPYGNRPLCIGKIGDGSYVLASESCALDTVDAEFVRDVDPGEIVVIDKNGINSMRILPKGKKALCIFEYIYFARPDSTIDGINVNYARYLMGCELAKESPIDVDVVVPVPDSGNASGIGYAETAKLHFSQGILKNRYVARTFIKPTQALREISVRLKLNPIKRILEGKRVAVVDDSIVRGTTSKKLVEILRKNGAKEVHLLISSPPVKFPCYYGIDTSERTELIAALKPLKEIEKYIGADSLHYLSQEGLYKAVGKSKGFCSACLDGNYPIPIPSGEGLGKNCLEMSNDKVGNHAK